MDDFRQKRRLCQPFYEEKKQECGAHSIPVKSAGELVDSLMRLIESRVVWVDTEQGRLPIADAMERGLAWGGGRDAEQGALITIAGEARDDD